MHSDPSQSIHISRSHASKVARMARDQRHEKATAETATMDLAQSETLLDLLSLALPFVEDAHLSKRIHAAIAKATA